MQQHINQQVTAANLSWELLQTSAHFLRLLSKGGGWGGALCDIQNSQACKLCCLHISFRCVVWKKGLFMNSNFSYCSLLNLTTQNQTENVRGLPGQLDLNLHFTTVELKIWYGINQIHVLITSLTINPCCTSLLVRMFLFPRLVSVRGFADGEVKQTIYRIDVSGFLFLSPRATFQL